MLEVGDLVYVSLRCNGAVVAIVGWGVELADDEIVIGTLAEVVASLTQKLLSKCGSVAFVRVPVLAVPRKSLKIGKALG